MSESAPASNSTVLCVDDEPNILSALRRLFRHSGHRIVVAGGGAQALQVLEAEPVDLIISDMRMPGMDGAQLLDQVRQRWPGITRLLLTGHADVSSTIAAINRGEIYRYISKPWNDEDLLLTVQHAFERRALEGEKRRLEALTQQQNEALKQLNAELEQRVAERTEALSQANLKLKKNYLTSIKVFSNLIELRDQRASPNSSQHTSPTAGHARRVADLARRMAGVLGMNATDTQDIFVAALLHDIGQIGLSDELLACPVARMTPDEKAQYCKHPALGEQALLALDDMQAVAALIRAHHERHDGRGFPDGLAGDTIPLGARILALADTFDDLQSGHLGRAGLRVDEARLMIERGRGSQFDAAVVDAFQQVMRPAPANTTPRVVDVTLDGLRPGMVLARELRSIEGVVLLAAEHVLSADLIMRIRALALRDRLDVVLQVHVQRV